MTVKVYDGRIFYNPHVKEENFIEVKCSCGYSLGYAALTELIPTRKRMFKCPICRNEFDILRKPSD